MGYVTKWLIIEEFSIFLNHRILSEKWVGMLQIIQMTHPFPKEYPVSHKNDYIFGEKPIVRTRGKLHQTKKLWFLHFVMMQIRRKSLNNEADLTLLLLKFHHLHSKMTRSARNDPPFSLRNDTNVLS